MRRGGRLQSEPVSGPIFLLCNPHCLPPCSRVGCSPNDVVSNPKAGKVSPPPSIPSKRTTSEGSSDPGPSRRPTMDSRRADSTRAQTKTPVPFTFSPATPMLQPPLRSTFNPEITSSTPQPTAKLIPQSPTFGSVPQFRFHTQHPSEDMPGGFTPPLDRAQASSTNVSHISNPKAGKVSSPSSTPSKQTTSEGFDSGSSHRPTMDSRHVDPTRAQTKTPVPLTFSPSTWPNKPTVICADLFPLSPGHACPLVNPPPPGSGIIPLSSATSDSSPPFSFPPMLGDNHHVATTHLGNYSTPSAMTTNSDSMPRHHTL